MIMRDLFDAAPMSCWELLTGRGFGFYIPAYQREYSWDMDNIDRLFEDFIHGVDMLLQADEKKHAVTFIGALIVIHDTNYQTVEPHIKGQLPGRVYLIIDGQQRLCTLLLLNAVMDEQITHKTEVLKKFLDEEDEATKWLVDKIERERQSTRLTIEENVGGRGDPEYAWYPRVTRAYQDTWSTERDRARYRSPIAAFLHGYGQFSRHSPGKKYVHEIPDGIDGEKHKIVQQNQLRIRDKLQGIASNSSDPEFPLWERILGDTRFQEALLGETIPEHLATILRGQDEYEAKDELMRELARLLVFAAYLNQRVAVTLVTAKSEEHAFDMFEALNTTGTPLTAFETFRPRVIANETLQRYERSQSRLYMQQVEDYLERYKDAHTKKIATDRLLIPFALTESGRALSKSLRDQRTYLKQSYEELRSLEEQRLYVRNMAHTAAFVKDWWPEKIEDRPQFGQVEFQDEDLVNLCLRLLRESKHEITIGPLVRFLSNTLLASKTELAAASYELEDAIKAMTAFWVFWRSVRRSTGGIDSRYRELMRDGNPIWGIDPFARRKSVKDNQRGYEYCKEPTAENLKKSLCHFLAEGNKKRRSYPIRSREDWIRLAREMPFYQSVPTPITRFLLLAATHNTHDDTSNPGLTTAAKANALRMLNTEGWQRYSTIEHIAPQSNSGANWPNELYDDPDLIHQIGNLTLLPPTENRAVGDRSWKHKRLLYQILSSPSIDVLQAQLAEAPKIGIQISNNTQEILSNAAYLPHIGSICRANHWDKEFVRSRSERMLELAWDRLAPWLGLS